MQSLCARRRVKSGGRGDEGFRVRLEVDGWRGGVRGGRGWVCAELEHAEHAEEACDELEQEFVGFEYE